MPVAGKIYTKKVELKGYPQGEEAWVELITNPKTGIRDDMPENLTKMQVSEFFLAKIIHDWNFTDEAGQKLPINPENVHIALSMPDMAYINDHLGLSALMDSKKNS